MVGIDGGGVRGSEMKGVGYVVILLVLGRSGVIYLGDKGKLLIFE